MALVRGFFPRRSDFLCLGGRLMWAGWLCGLAAEDGRLRLRRGGEPGGVVLLGNGKSLNRRVPSILLKSSIEGGPFETSSWWLGEGDAIVEVIAKYFLLNSERTRRLGA